MHINTVTLIGAGAVGCLYGARINKYLGKEQLQVIAEGKRLERYQSDGIVLNGEKVDFNYVSPEQANPTDLIILATKNLQLQDALTLMEKAVKEDTIILSLLNGIESEGHIADRYGKEHLLYSYCVGLSSMHQGNAINATSEGKIVFGEKDNVVTDRVKAVKALFDACGIQSEVPENIQLSMWKKFMLNTAFNTLSAITWSGYGDFKEPELQELAMRTSLEVIAVANKEGIPLTENLIDENLNTIVHLAANGMTSMFQDMVAGRKTENDFFCGTIVRLGQKHHIPTPTCEVLALITSAEEKSRRRAITEQVHYQ